MNVTKTFYQLLTENNKNIHRIKVDSEDWITITDHPVGTWAIESSLLPEGGPKESDPFSVAMDGMLTLLAQLHLAGAINIASPLVQEAIEETVEALSNEYGE